MIVMHRYTRFGLLALLAASHTGCGGHNAGLPKLVPVSGRVTLDHKPLSGAMVAFIPAGNTRGRGATGYTDAQGRYELHDPEGQKGAPAGEYRVIVTKLLMPDGSDFPLDSGVAPIDSPARQILPARYSDDRQTTLKALVGDQGGTLDFALESEPVRAGDRGGPVFGPSRRGPARHLPPEEAVRLLGTDSAESHEHESLSLGESRALGPGKGRLAVTVT
jgi:hypothetical protein